MRLPRPDKSGLAMTGLSELSLRGALSYCLCEESFPTVIARHKVPKQSGRATLSLRGALATKQSGRATRLPRPSKEGLAMTGRRGQ